MKIIQERFAAWRERVWTDRKERLLDAAEVASRKIAFWRDRAGGQTDRVAKPGGRVAKWIG